MFVQNLAKLKEKTAANETIPIRLVANKDFLLRTKRIQSEKLLQIYNSIDSINQTDSLLN